MTSFATLGGVPIVSGSLVIPLYGMWAGDVRVATGVEMPDSVEIVLGNLTMVGHVYRQRAFAGATSCRLVAGTGGWREMVTARQYYFAGGVPLRMVIQDVAKEVGETAVVDSDESIGDAYVRQADRASLVLRQLAGANWYVDNDGVTQISAWPSDPVQSAFTIEEQDPARGLVTVATEDYASWMPGCTFAAPNLAGTFANGGVRYSFDGDGRFRLEVLTQ